jgi:hypothetical protein
VMFADFDAITIKEKNMGKLVGWIFIEIGG